MKNSRVVVPWEEGLHLRPAARLVRVAQRFQSKISMGCDGNMADLRNILGVIALCATMGTVLNIEVSGDDEQDAVRAVEQVFQTHDGEGSGGNAGSIRV